MKRQKRKAKQFKPPQPDLLDPSAVITPTRYNLAFAVLVALLLAGLLLYFISISRNYPYYFVWDMDLVSALDTVLMHSDQLPDHINHPGFGMYFLLYFTTGLAHAADIVSVLNLADVANCPNPMPAMAELTIFLRMHSPFLAVGIIFLLWAAICQMFQLPRWQQILLLLVLATQESLVYHASMVRTEFYGVFYWSGAVLLAAVAAKATRPSLRVILLLAAGLATGLSLQTKLQGLFYVAVFPILFLLMRSLDVESPPATDRRKTDRIGYGGLVLSSVNLLVFLFLCVASWGQDVPEILPNTVSKYTVATPATKLLFSTLLALFAGQLIILIRRRGNTPIARLLGCFNLLATGFLVSFACHFLMYSQLSLSWRHLLYDFKVLFFRDNYYSTRPTANYRQLVNYLKILWSAIVFRPAEFLILLGLTCVVIIGSIFKAIRLTKKQIAMILIIVLVVLVNVAMATRSRVRDILWREVLLNFTSILLFATVVTRSIRARPMLITFGTGAMVLLLTVNCLNSRTMPSRTDANFNHYGFRQYRWFSATFREGGQLQYARIMGDKYALSGDRSGIMRRQGQAGAAHPERIRRMVDFVFKNQTITLRNIGMAFKGFAVWADQPDLRITSMPGFLSGAIIIDNSSLPLRSDKLFAPGATRKHTEVLNKIRGRSIEGVLSVLTRQDLEVILFVHKDDIARVTDEYIVKPRQPWRITLGQGRQTIQMYGLLVKGSSEILREKIRNNFFFAIVQR